MLRREGRNAFKSEFVSRHTDRIADGKYAWTVTVGEKGQIVIPKQARDVFQIRPGDTLLLLGDESRGLAIPPKSMIARITASIFDGGENGDEPV